MSTILKALKKLEQEKEGHRHPAHRQAFLGTGPTIAGRSGIAGWRYKQWFQRGFVVALIIILGGTTFYFYQQSRPAHRSKQIQTGQRETPAPQKAQGPKKTATGRSLRSPESRRQQPVAATPPLDRAQTGRVRPKTAARQQTAEDQRASAISRQQQRPTAPATKPMPGVSPQNASPPWQSLKDLTKAAPKPAPIAEPAEKERPQSAMRQESDSPDRDRGQSSSSMPDQPASAMDTSETSIADEYGGARQLTDGRLKVQALAWSPIAQDRMAVLNTRIVHEGDKVDGFSVLAIRQNDVIVREKGVIYRVAFGQP